ncbi:MAG: ribonuclease E inhibitor RraB [Terracidiphilus sp.]
MIYPEDDNGDVLRRLEAQGDDLTWARNIDFSVVFPVESAAERFAEHFRARGYAASVYFAETMAEFPWNVNVVKHMTPSHQGISDFETTLQEVADTLGGCNDGWGCFSEPS